MAPVLAWRARVALVVLIVVASAGAAMARIAPTLTIQNNANEEVLVHLVGPGGGYMAVAAAARTAPLADGTYRLFFRWGTSRYHYTKLDDPIVASDGDRYTITLFSVAGNADEEPSNESEFNGR